MNFSTGGLHHRQPLHLQAHHSVHTAGHTVDTVRTLHLAETFCYPLLEANLPSSFRIPNDTLPKPLSLVQLTKSVSRYIDQQQEHACNNRYSHFRISNYHFLFPRPSDFERENMDHSRLPRSASSSSLDLHSCRFCHSRFSISHCANNESAR